MDSLPCEWACGCPVCESVKQNGIPVIDAMSVEDLKRHFLICRKLEILRVQRNIDDELDSVEAVAEWIEARSLPGVIPVGIGARLSSWAASVRRLV